GAMANGYTLKAIWQPTSGPALDSATSQPFNVGAQRQNNGLKVASSIPSTYPVGTVLPSIEVDLTGTDGKILANDSTDRITLKSGGTLCPLTETAVNDKAIFNDLINAAVPAIGAGIVPPLLLQFAYANFPNGVVSASPIPREPGPATGLAFIGESAAI